MPKPRIAVFSGATATIQNSQPLVTSEKARRKHGLPSRADAHGSPLRFDALRPQRLAAPVTVYVEQFSAHPLERDAAALYGPPDGYVDAAGRFHRERQGPQDVPVYEIRLEPGDGLYPLPYMARQADGTPWDGDGAGPLAPAERSRQPFYPDASRIFEEIDRLGVGDEGVAGLLAARASYDFYRAAPSGGYTQGLPAAERTDVGEGDIAPERLGRDFFPYRPAHLRREPSAAILARLTDMMQSALAGGRYAGAIWLEGSPSLEETAYWLNLMLDTPLPVVGNASQRPHGAVANDGDGNLIDAVDYILSGIWRGAGGLDDVGVVVVQDERIFTAREVQKADARPGGYVATGGHGGVVGTMGKPGPAALTFLPARRHTHRSEVNLSRVPDAVPGPDGVPVRVKDERGRLRPEAIPAVTLVKEARYLHRDEQEDADVMALVARRRAEGGLAGLVVEGTAPYGGTGYPTELALRRAALSGLAVVRVGRGNAEGITPHDATGLTVGGSNLTATKARLLLTACLLRHGSPPRTADPDRPSEGELAAVRARVRAYQEVFDTH